MLQALYSAQPRSEVAASWEVDELIGVCPCVYGAEDGGGMELLVCLSVQKHVFWLGHLLQDDARVI
jgi:hypothetical protein